MALTTAALARDRARAERDELRPVRLMDGNFAVPSASEPGRAYRVQVVGVAAPACDCPGFATHGHCKHVGGVRGILERERETAVLSAGPGTDATGLFFAERPRRLPERAATPDEIVRGIFGDAEPAAGERRGEERPVSETSAGTAATSLAGVAPEFIVERQGRRFALLAGLVDLAHREGLRGIATEIVQIGREDVGEVWIVRAVATLADGRSFSGIGDASPGNASAQMRGCLCRLAESRAIGRALRWATNAAALVALEELAGDDHAEVAAAPVTPAPLSRSAASGPGPVAGAIATERQVAAARAIGKERGLDGIAVDEMAREAWGRNVAELSRAECSALIDQLKGAAAAKR